VLLELKLCISIHDLTAEIYFLIPVSWLLHEEYEVKSYVDLYGRSWPYVCFICETAKSISVTVGIGGSILKSAGEIDFDFFGSV
jgi:hypothetical protein